MRISRRATRSLRDRGPPTAGIVSSVTATGGRVATCAHRHSLPPSGVRTRWFAERLARTRSASPSSTAWASRFALAVADGDHPGARAGRRELPRPLEPGDPAPAVLLRILPKGRVHREQAQGPALRRHRQPGVGEEAGAALASAADPVQALRGLQAAVVQRRRVLQGKDDGHRPAAVGGGLEMRFQNVLHGYPRVRQQPVGGLLFRLLRKDDREVFAHVLHPGPAHVNDDGFPVEDLAAIYRARWRLEEQYKVAKWLLAVESFRAENERGVLQELYASFVIVTATHLMTNEIDGEINAAPSDGHPKRVNFKNAAAAVFCNFETLALAQADALTETVSRIVDDVAALWQRERPGRSYPRMSRKPRNKWSRKGKVAAAS